jgi:hypothetical protein
MCELKCEACRRDYNEGRPTARSATKPRSSSSTGRWRALTETSWKKASKVGRGRTNETSAMDFVHDQLVTGRKLRVITIVDMFSRLWSLVSTSAAPMWWRCWKKLAEKSPSLCHAIWICGRTSAVSRSTSRDLENQQTTPSLNLSTASSEQNV